MLQQADGGFLISKCFHSSLVSLKSQFSMNVEKTKKFLRFYRSFDLLLYIFEVYFKPILFDIGTYIMVLQIENAPLFSLYTIKNLMA